MAKLADAADLKSADLYRSWGFKSPSGHQKIKELIENSRPDVRRLFCSGGCSGGCWFLPRVNHELKIANRELGTVEAIESSGGMKIKLDNGQRMTLNPEQYAHLDHGYAVTSHSSQGQTADRVLIHVDTDLAAKDLLNNRMAYVAVSRGQWDAQIFTNDRGALGNALGRDLSHQSAYQPQQAIAPTVVRDVCPDPGARVRSGYRDEFRNVNLQGRVYGISI